MKRIIQILSSAELHIGSFFKVIEIAFFSRKWLSLLIFIVGFCVFTNMLGLYDYLHTRPSSIHMSAQTSRASIALNYYKGDMNFFKPMIHRHLIGEGITGIEFPIIYYAAAVCYKLFEFDEFYLRVISLITVVFGFSYFFLFYNRILKNAFISFSVLAALIVSPVLLFYTPSSMPDAPSVALQLGSWYFMYLYIQEHKTSYLLKFVLMASLAALIKATSAIVFVIVICLIIADYFKFFKSNNQTHLFRDKGKVILALLGGLAIVFSWYLYARWLGKHYNNAAFALEPVMSNGWEEIKITIETIVNLWKTHLYAYETYVLLLGFLTLFIALLKWSNRFISLITILYVLGLSCYIYLFNNQFRWHDYYFIAILPACLFIVLTVLETILRHSSRVYGFISLLILTVFFFNIKESSRHTKKIYHERNSREIYYWTGDYRAYEDLEIKLRKLGIKRNDKFLSGYDPTWCGSLYLMDQAGTTFGEESVSEDIKFLMNNPEIKYLVLNDSVKFKKLYPVDLTEKVIASHRGLLIYKLR